MEPLLLILGSGCLAWTAAELSRLMQRPTARFGAVDPERGREIEVVLDRRTRSRRRFEARY